MAGLIHVGAWRGLEYRHDKRRLLLFEPQAEPFVHLKASLGRHENVEVVNLALGSEEGVGLMHTADPDHSSSLLTPSAARGDVSFDGTETVPLTTLDRFMGDREGFDTLRIDTQGYELEVLRGARKTLESINRVECEIHDPVVYPGAGSLEEIDHYLAGLGFTRTSFDVEGSDDLGDAVYERLEN